jgi:hypothetical protein
LVIADLRKLDAAAFWFVMDNRGWPCRCRSAAKSGKSWWISILAEESVTAQSTALTNERTAIDIARRRLDASVLLVKAVGGLWDST